MSYCRFSSNDFQCDVYVYESNQGFVTHVAASRFDVAPDEFPPQLAADANPVDFVNRHLEVQAILEAAETLPIDSPHAGQTYLSATPGECAALLRKLAEDGFQVPQRAIDALTDEQEELGTV